MTQFAESDKSNQVKSVLRSPNAIIKLIGVALIWKMTGLTLAFAFNFGIFIIFIVIFYTILWLFPYWQPAYSIVYRIVGNNDISPTLEPLHMKWWQYISPGIRFVFLAYLLYIGINLLLK
jgi:hypothetical protein